MSDRGRTRPTRAPLAVGGALIAAVALAGCGAGQISQTARQVAAVEGANATAGPIAVRNATIEFDVPVEGDAVYPAGAAAPLDLTIVNSGSEADRLVAAGSPIASSVEVSGTLLIPGGQALGVEGAPPAPAAPVAAEPTGEAAPEATPAATPGEAPATPLPGDDATPPPPIDEGEPGVANIVLTGLREDLQAGRTYPVVLTFERAGDVRFDIPVANPDTLREPAGH